MSQNKYKQELILDWYEAYSAMLVKYITGIVKDGYQAEDIMQETFLKTYRYVENKKIEYPKTFLFRIAHNLAIDHIRKIKPIEFVKELFVKDSADSVSEIMEVKEESKLLYQAIQALKPNYRQVIILRKIEEFSIQDTATILNWSESKVKSTLYRAVRALEKDLTKGGYLHETK